MFKIDKMKKKKTGKIKFTEINVVGKVCVKKNKFKKKIINS